MKRREKLELQIPFCNNKGPHSGKPTKILGEFTEIVGLEKPPWDFPRKDGNKWGSLRVEDVAGLRDRQYPKGQGLLRKEGPPTYALLQNLVLSHRVKTNVFVAKLSNVAIYALFERLSQGFQRKPSCIRRAFNESNRAFVELSTKAILLS